MALDTLSALLRQLKSCPIVLDDEDYEHAREQCEPWAQHILLGTSPPGVQNGQKSERRDWATLRRFIMQFRQKEMDLLSTTIATLRASIGDFAQAFSRLAIHGREEDARLKLQVDKIRAVCQSEDVAEMRRELIDVAAALADALEHRQRLQQQTIGGLASKIRELSGELDQARKEGMEDPLSRVFTRKVFDEYLQRVASLDGAFGTPSSLLLVDIDDLGSINNSYSQKVGDDVLRRVGDCLSRTFIRKTDCVARFGGDEFAIILRDTTGADAKKLAERLLASVRKMRANGPESETVTVTIGLSQMEDGMSAQQWLGRAETGLRRAKQQGPDCVAEASAKPGNSLAPR